MSIYKKNERYKVTVTGMTDDGSGVAKIDGFAVFIPETAIGDHVEIQLLKVLKNYAFGKVVRIISPSADRIEPDCTLHAQCGGCTYRHISYDAELTIKQDIVAQAFTRLGGFGLPCDDIIGSERVNGYRNKAQYPVAIDKDNQLVCGFFAKRSHRVVNCSDCKLQTCEFEKIKAVVLKFIDELHIKPYDEVTQLGTVRHIYIRKAEATNQIMVCLVVKGNLHHEQELVATLTGSFPQIASIVINRNDNNTNVILGSHCKTIFGADYIVDIICDIKVKISALAFYQVNRLQAEVLYRHAINLANITKNDTVIDLYCGTGTIGLVAAQAAKQVIGVEIIPQAIENARENAVLNGIKNVEFICGDATLATQNLLSRTIQPDAVIVDPPRKGLDSAVIDAIAKMAPDRVVMVSCNPATAARDCRLLCGKGYEMMQIVPVDMFPRTGHVECVVKLCRVEK